MIVKLRRKFIGIAMCSMALVLTLMIAGINIASFINVCHNADRRITMIADNGGRLPQNMKDGKEFSQDQRKTDEKQQNAVGKKDFWERSLSPEAAFDTRFFTITFLPDGEIAQTDLGKIASISNEDATDYAEALYEKGRQSGFIDCYRYRAQQTADEKTMYIFVNCERELNAFYTFLTASVGISLLGLFLVFLLVVIFSRIMMRPVAESYQKQKRFITDASHEIKTPLTIIDANTEILEMTEGENKWTKSTRKQVARLTSLTEKLVFLSRMDEDAVPVEMQDFDISDAVLDTAEPFISLAGSREKTLTLQIQPGIRFHGNEAMIRQLVSLLLDNAVKYSDEKGRILLTLCSHAKGCQLTVTNSVSSIPPGRHDELFERFYRPDSSRSKETGGFGIGLSVAYAIVTTHKGKISAKSEDGTSLTVSVRL